MSKCNAPTVEEVAALQAKAQEVADEVTHIIATAMEASAQLAPAGDKQGAALLAHNAATALTLFSLIIVHIIGNILSWVVVNMGRTTPEGRAERWDSLVKKILPMVAQGLAIAREEELLVMEAGNELRERRRAERKKETADASNG